MDYLTLFKEKHIEDSAEYPRNDIGIAKLFYDLHSGVICYVVESKTWYTYTGKVWKKDEGGLWVMERCKDFAQALIAYAESRDDGDEDSKAFIKYAGGFHSRRRREGLLSDARSIAPKSLAAFDSNRTLFNCHNGTLNLQNFGLQSHRAEYYITKISRVRYDAGASCARWERFVDEVMCGDTDTALFLQKALGYALTGDTSLECFFILYGNTTRNGKSTLSETVAYILGDYARTIQPQTLSRRPSDGSSASPDIARLKGARLVNMPEPEKGLELNIALVKQLTGGDTYTGRFLNENPIEFRPECKFFINTNHLPDTSDNTIFTSERVKLIPFDRHFTPEEQDNGLKKLFRKRENMSGILNWLMEGYRLMLETGMDAPPRVTAAVDAYRQETDTFGAFLSEYTVEKENAHTKTSILYANYSDNALPELAEGQRISSVKAELKEGFTSPKKAFTEDTLLSAMETAGDKVNCPTGAREGGLGNFSEIPDAERKGLGTPATRAGIIEKLVKSEFVKRDKKQLIPTDKAHNLIAVVPELIKSPMLTAEWEQALKEIECGKSQPNTFISSITAMITSIVQTNKAADPEKQNLFPSASKGEIIGKCPRCNDDVTEKQKGFFCNNRDCSFALWKDNKFFMAKKKTITKPIAKALLDDGRIAMTGLYSEKTGKKYSATILLDNAEPYGKYVRFKMEF